MRASVVASARLHMGFLDMHGGLGRKFGGLGLSLERPVTRLTLTPAPQNKVEGDSERDRAARLLAIAGQALAPGKSFSLTLHETIPAHAGLGSGTQLALAVAAALRALEGLEQDAAGDAALLERGARSGLGAGLFKTGGLIVDGGRGPATLTPPVIAQMNFPEDWRAILVSAPGHAGLHGAEEREAFAALPPLSEAASGELCRLVLMQALPGVKERDLPAFGAAITRIQEIVGDHFAPAQGGRRFTSPKVEALVGALLRDSATGGGQTSWGPTGFVFVESETAAQRLVMRFGPAARGEGLTLTIHKALNRGAKVDAVYAQMA